ncbi:hypothetical protein LINPERHAP2_LOCUS19036 [Linum perenne]
MDSGHETGSSTKDSQTESSTRVSQTESSTRDSQSHPVAEKEDEQDDSIEEYPKLRIRTESGGFPVEISQDQTSNGDGISSKNSSVDHSDIEPEVIKKGMGDKSVEPTHTEEKDGSSSTSSIKIDSGVIARNHSSEHLESEPETVGGGSGGDDGGSHVEESQQPALSQSHDHPTSEDTNPRSPIIKMGSSSSSSSSESSLDKGAFPGDLDDDFNPRSPREDDQLSKDTISEQNKPEEHESSSVSPAVPSPGSEITLSGFSPIQSPPVQVMQRSEGYDPNRIPSSVFQRSSSDAQNDWSIASNESLFSIHVGTSTSFSREQAAFIKAEDAVLKQNEPFSFTAPNPSNETLESPNSPTAFPVLEHADADAATSSSPAVEPQKQKAKETEISRTPPPNPIIESAKRAAEEHRIANQKKPPTVSWRSTSISSQNSTKSFAFPILNDEARLESSSGTGRNKEEQPEEIVTGAVCAAGAPAPRKAKRRWYRFPWCPWKKWCSSSCCSSCSCRCFRCTKCCRC